MWTYIHLTYVFIERNCTKESVIPCLKMALNILVGKTDNQQINKIEVF